MSAMTETFAWVFDKLFFFLPRLQVIHQFEGAVFLRDGRHLTKFRKFSFLKFWKFWEIWIWKDTPSLDPGLYWFLPFRDDIFTINILDQTIDLRCQSALTKDGKDVVISGAILYCVNTPHKALLNVEDVDRCLSRAALGVLVKAIKTRSFQEIVDLDFCTLEEELKQGVKDIAKNWGLRIKEVQITDIGSSVNLRLLKNEEDSIMLED